MAWYAWALVIVAALNCGAKIALTGQRKDPPEHTPGEALITLIWTGLLVWAIIAAYAG